MNIERKYSEQEISDYINRNSLELPVDDVLSFWDERKWRTQKGSLVKTLAAAVNVCNSLYVTKTRSEKGVLNYNKGKRSRYKIYEKYKIQLSRPEWLAFREFIFVVKGKKCELCGSLKDIQIHHKRYINGRLAWEYIPDDVVVLCGNCHKRIHDLD